MTIKTAFKRAAAAGLCTVVILSWGFTPDGKAAANDSTSSMLRESGVAITKNKLD